MIVKFVAAAVLAALLLVGPSALRAASGDPNPPQVVFKDLFSAVQNAEIFADSKEFADAVPTTAPDDILAEYHRRRPATREALKRFVDAHFDLPRAAAPPPAPHGPESLTEYIDRLWNPLTRATLWVPRYSSLLALPRPYLVPGGRFRELYYWDSYFTLLGAVQRGRPDLAQNMVRDFAYLIDTYGHVPNGARTYYLSRSQPPFFFEMVGLLSPRDRPSAYGRYLPQLRREYDFWMKGFASLHPGMAARRAVSMEDGSVLNRFWDDRNTPRDEAFREDSELARVSGREPRQLFKDIRAAAESGWDFSSRWFADGRTRASLDTTEIVPVDLNSLMFGLEKAIGAGCRRTGNWRCARDFEHRAALRRAAIDRYLWDAATGAYLDYRWTHRERIPRLSAASLYPLFVGLASEAQAAGVAAAAQRSLLDPGGLVTTPLDTGQQWDSPNGWAPLQWIAVDGLRRYGHDALAATIACRWMSGVNRVYRESGKLVEKYDVVTTGRQGGGGEYPTQDGFGWTNGVSAALIAQYPELSSADDADRCPPP